LLIILYVRLKRTAQQSFGLGSLVEWLSQAKIKSERFTITFVSKYSIRSDNMLEYFKSQLSK